ncbi:glycosyltransferase [Leucobacter sp. OH2974_COT-288]|nr:glycosyltransferase [Leucobacter sp. OH2974_COT-288]
MSAVAAEKPQKIALVIDYSLDYLGGAQTAFLDAARALQDAGYEVLVVAPQTAHNRWRAQWQGATHLVRPRGVIPVLELPVLRHTAQLRQELREVFARSGVTVVHTHSEFGLTAAARAAARELSLPTAHTVHTFFWDAQLQPVVDRAAAVLVRAAVRWLTGTAPRRLDLAPRRVDSLLRDSTLGACLDSDITVSPSAHQAARLRAAGAAPVAVIANPSVSAHQESDPYDTVTLPLRLVWVGRLVPEKRLLEFIAAIRLACEQGLRDVLQVEVVGAGPLAKRAQQLAAGLPIRFQGRVDRAGVLAAMRRAHAVVLSSAGFDNQPVVIVEAVNSGRPVLLCDRNLTEGLQGGSGIYTADTSPAAFAELLQHLVADPAQLVTASQATLKDRAEFSPTTHVKRLLTAYREVGF